MRQPRWRRRVFVGGQGVNALGSMVSSMALPLVAIDRLHASTFVVGALEAVEWLPAVLIGLFAGALLDRHRAHTRHVMMAANLGQAASVAAIPAAAAAGILSVPVLLAAAANAGLFTVWFQAGYSPYVRALVESDDYLAVNGQTRGMTSLATVTGPTLAGALVETVGSAATILADAASFLVSFVSLAVLPDRTAPSSEPREPLAREIKRGVAHLYASPLLRTLAWATASVNLFLTAIGAIEIVFLVREVHAPADWIGLLIAFGGVGGIVGAVLAPRLSRRFGLERLARTAVAATAPAVLLMPLTSHGAGMAYFALAGLAASLGISAVSISFSTLRLQHCPAHLLARVSTTSRTLSATTIPVGALLGGALGQFAGTRTALLILAAGYLALGVVLLVTPSLRELPMSSDGNPKATEPMRVQNAAS